MFFRKKQEEAVVVLEEEAVVVLEEIPESHCAWCSDPPDQYGSHGICSFHAERMEQQLQVRRSRRNRE